MGAFTREAQLREPVAPASESIFNVPSLGGCVFGWGPTMPTDASTGWAPGALFLATTTKKAYVNGGDATSSAFKLVTSA